MTLIKQLAGPVVLVAMTGLVYAAVSGDAAVTKRVAEAEAQAASEAAASEADGQPPRLANAAAQPQVTPDLTNPKCRPQGYGFLIRSWPDINFKRCEINLEGVRSGGPPVDGIPAFGITFTGNVMLNVQVEPEGEPAEGEAAPAPQFRSEQLERMDVKYMPAEDIPAPPESIVNPGDNPFPQPGEDDPKFWLGDSSPVVELVVDGDARAYPLSVLTLHEITNTRIGGELVAVTYCPLCNTAMVFDRRVAGKTLNFGVSGLLRNSDLIMYDQQTKSWWQQYEGRAIAGEMSGASLDILPSRIISFAEFKREHGDDALVQVPTHETMRRYGFNPYRMYDTAERPFLYDGETPAGIKPMDYVVAIGDRAWSLDLLIAEGEIETEDDYKITVAKGADHIAPASALDGGVIATSRALQTVTVTRDGDPAPTKLTFAFAFFAFNPDGVLMTPDGEVRRESGGEAEETGDNQ